MIIPLIAAALFNYINVPVAEMRENPRQEAEIVSQALFSEPVRILEEQEGWLKIETTVDHYQGWVKQAVVYGRDDPFLTDSGSVVAKVDRCAAHLYSVEDTVYGPLLTLPFESKLKVIEPIKDSTSRWVKVQLHNGTIAYIQRGDIQINPTLISKDEMCKWSFRFLGLPYTWGGRSSFGYDCSGFTQMLYRQMGVYLPRDARDQAKWEGFVAIPIDQVMPGDLIFFGLAEDKIRHVVLYIGNNQFIHPTVRENAPYIHVSNLSDIDWNGSGHWLYRTARTLKQ